LRKPSIAAINGFAMGGGLEFALSCTFRIASTKARLGLPEMGLGIIPAFGGTERLTRTVGYAKASEMLLRRTIINGEEALAIGLVNQVAEPEQLMDKAKEWALDLASLSPVAVRLELELLLNATGQGLDEALALESALGSLAVASPEAKELLGAFVNKGKK
jgi:enoyl-CoA hydratase